MVSTTNDTYDTLYKAIEAKKYKQFVPAAGLFWKRTVSYDSNNKPVYDYGFRIEAPTIMREFTNNVNFGAGASV
jgi:hypothetical protein